MLYKVGRFLQFAGLIIIPIAIAGNVVERNNEPVLSEARFLMLAAVGCVVFFCGWLLQQSSRPK